MGSVRLWHAMVLLSCASCLAMSDTAAIIAILEANSINVYKYVQDYDTTKADSLWARDRFINSVTKFYREGPSAGRAGVFHPEAGFLGGDTLTVLPDAIGALTELEYLYLHHNKIESLPDAIGRLKKLIIFKIPFNRLTALPDSIVNLTQLGQIRLEGNHICGSLSPAITDWLENRDTRGLDQQECSSTVLLMPRTPVSERPWSSTGRHGRAFTLNGRCLPLVAAGGGAVSKACGTLLIGTETGSTGIIGRQWLSTNDSAAE